MKCRALLILILAGILGSCSHDSSSHGMDVVFERFEEIPGFLKVISSHKSVILGTDESDAKDNERPRMKASFDYDFAMSRNEVTCGEFNQVMGKADLPEGLISHVDCDDDSLPVVNVSFYDAVLFANALSLHYKKDTAYSYQSVSVDGDGHCNGLTGLTFLPEAEAFRLPSEAEWMIAAAGHWDLSRGWTAENSGYESHTVCSLEKDSLSFCDMEGNVKEFVGDWLGKFSDTTVTNFLGSPKGDGLGQRVLKGGSFKHGKNGTKIYRRGDDYVVTSSTRADYVGFRLAYGFIPDPSWLNGGAASGSNSVSMVNSFDMKKLVGTVQAKLVFRNDISGNLEFVDYSIGSSKFTVLDDSLEAFHPDISPDGNWVAFCTGMEGVKGNSDIYVRRLDVTGSGLVKLDVKGAAIPRWRITADGDTVIIYVSDASNNENRSEFLERSTWQVSFSGGKFGKPEKLFDGAFHGGVSRDNRLAVTGARLLRARMESGDGKALDSVWYEGEQACNVSLSRDGSGRTLFLDFGSKVGQKFDGKEYGVHERILVVDSVGKLVQSIASPENYSFDHSEWTYGDLGVATLSNVNGAHEKIVLVDMKAESVTDLVRGDELWHPALWIKNAGRGTDINPDESSEDSSAFVLDADSAGVYLFEDDTWGSVLMRYNMELLWRYYDSVNVAIVGSSRPLYSLSPSAMDDRFFAVNFAHTPNSIYASRDFLETYLFDHLKNLKYVVVSLDIDFWWKKDGSESDNFFKTNVKKYPGYVYDAHHDYWKEGVPAGLPYATEDALKTDGSEMYLDDRGRFLGTICSSWGKEPEVEIDSTVLDDSELLDNSVKALEEIVKESKKRGVTVVGMIFPQSPAYKETGAFGRYGLRRSKAKKLIQQIENLQKEYSNFVLMDENKMGDHDYTDEMAVDYDHLCDAGAVQITRRLDSLLSGLASKELR